MEQPSAQVSQEIVWRLQKIKGRPRDRRWDLQRSAADAVFHASESQASIPPCSQNFSDPNCGNQFPHMRDMDTDPEAEHMSKARSCYSSLQVPRITGTRPGLLLLGQEFSQFFFALVMH